MIDREKVIREYENYVKSFISLTTSDDKEYEMHEAVLALLKEQHAEIEQLRNDVNARRCNDCKNKECWGRAGNVVCGIDGTPHRPDWFCKDFDPSNEAIEDAFGKDG